MPVVIRIPYGGGIGAVEHHSESPEALFAHTPGLRVVACSGPADAYWMIQQSIACDDPVIFFEPKRRYWDKAEVDTAAGLAGALPLTSGRTVAEGTDVTVLAYGPMVRTCVEAAVAAREDGRALEVIDVRSLSPLDTGPSWPRCAAPAGAWSCTRPRSPEGSAPRSPPGSPRSASTSWRPRCCGSAGSPPRIRRPGWKSTTCPTWTGCSMPSTARLRSERPGMAEVKQFRLPDVGEGLTEADIVTWRVKPGDQVSINQVIVEIETAKSLVELPSPYEGVVSGLLVAEGETVDVGTPIIEVDVAVDAGTGPGPATPDTVRLQAAAAEVAARLRAWFRHRRKRWRGNPGSRGARRPRSSGRPCWWGTGSSWGPLPGARGRAGAQGVPGLAGYRNRMWIVRRSLAGTGRLRGRRRSRRCGSWPRTWAWTWPS